MDLPKVFTDWLKYRVDDGCTQIFSDSISENPGPHCITLEGGYMRLYVWSPHSFPSPDILIQLRNFIMDVGITKEGCSELAKKLIQTLNEGVVIEQDEDSIEWHERPTITVELVSPRNLSHEERANLEWRLQEELNLSFPSGESLVTAVNFHWVDAAQDEPRRIKCEVQSPLLYTDGAEENCSLKFEVLRFGDIYHDLTKRGGEAIYASNVRSFLGSSITNGRLRATYEKIIDAGESSQDFSLFPFKNNGITISCTDLECLENGIGIKYPQIVNGQQTIRTWESVYARHDEDGRRLMEKIPVVVRFVRLPNEALVRQVAFANNRQNPISSDILRSNEPILVNIETRWNQYVPEGLPAFFRKGNSGKRESVTPKKLFQIHHHLLKGVRPSQREVEKFFDEDKSFDAFFKKLYSRIVKEKSYLAAIGTLVKFYGKITTNNKKTNPERKRIINTAFGLDGRKAVARHPFFAVGKPGWQLCVWLFLQAISRDINPEKDLPWHAEQANGRLDGVADIILDDLKSFSTTPAFSEEYEEPLDKHPDIWQEWLEKKNRYGQFINEIELKSKGIV